MHADAVPDLTRLASEAAAEAGPLDADLLGDHLAAVLDVAGTGRRLTRAELDRYRRRGEHAAEAGVALRALVELHLSATWRLWPQLPAVRNAGRDPSGVVDAGAAVLRAADDGIAALTEGYQLARQSVVRRQDAARREFFDDLLAGQGDLAGLVARAEDFGLDLAAPHAVAVVRAEHPFADATPIVGRLERAILGRRGDANALVASKDADLVVVFAAPDDAALDYVTGRLQATLGSGSQARFGAWQIGLGRPRSGPTGIRGSYEEALEALDLAGRLGLDAPLVRAVDLLVYRVVLRDRDAIAELIGTLLTPLASARPGPQVMLDTLAAYFASGGSVAASARALHLSVRAMSYRLARIAALLGRDPTDPGERLALHVAVVGAQLLGWPEQPLSP